MKKGMKLTCDDCAGICWTGLCTGPCAHTPCAYHDCQLSNTGTSGGGCDCSGCSGCGGSCDDTCTDTCDETCNVECKDGAVDDLAARLKLSRLIEDYNFNDVQDLLIHEITRRPNLKLEDYQVGKVSEKEKITKNKIKQIQDNLTALGHSMTEVATLGKLITKSFGENMIKSALDSFKEEVGVDF